MQIQIAFLTLFSFFISFIICNGDFKKSTVLIAILVRNKAHVLPYFLSYLDQQNYPKDRISLWIRSDNNIDNSIKILNSWLQSREDEYHSIDILLDETSNGFSDEKGIADWSNKRFAHVIALREAALNHARNIWADYVWLLDADILLTDSNILSDLIYKNYTIVAPMLRSDGMYSNFWAGMTEDYYYKRTDEYEPILYRQKIGCFNVPMIHSAILINLKKSESNFLKYQINDSEFYNGPIDDIIIFALQANMSDVPLHICNDKDYGFVMIPLESDNTLLDDYQQFINLKTEVISRYGTLSISNDLQQFIMYPNENTLGFDNVYMINLVRRPERKTRMKNIFKELGLKVEIINAVDGKDLSEKSLDKLGIRMLENYADPYHNRPITSGEIGCFLSHFLIWNKVLDNNYTHVMVLEDDVRFEPFFRQKVLMILQELENLSVQWDIIYLGRKKLLENGELRVHNSKYLVHAEYSYWTLGYLLSNNGAKKLIQADPLSKLVPVDEYLPILSNKHPRNDWKIHFSNRNLIVLSTDPLLIHPTHYTGEQGYISDTENSNIVNLDIHNKDEL